MQSLTGSSNNVKSKSFFQKPEGKVGRVFLILAGIGALIILYQALPWIIILLTNAIHATLLFIALAFILFLITNKKIRSLVSLGFKMIMRFLTGWFVELNPIAILRIHIENMINRREAVKEYISDLKGEIHKMERKLDTNKKDFETNMNFARSAKKDGSALAKKKATVKVNQAKRLQESSIKFSVLLDRMKKIEKILMLMHENLGLFIDDLTNEVDWRETEYKTVRAAHSALKASESVLQGSPDERAMFELGLEKLEDDVCSKLGNMDMILDMSEGFLVNMDIENGVMEEEGMLMLEELESKGVDEIFKEFDPEVARKNMDANRRAEFETETAERKSNSTFKQIKKNEKGRYF